MIAIIIFLILFILCFIGTVYIWIEDKNTAEQALAFFPFMLGIICLAIVYKGIQIEIMGIPL